MTLHYKFPRIEHIDDVLPHIQNRPEFIVAKKDCGITIINYVFQDTNTFPPVVDTETAMLRECRGLVFYSDSGKTANRRFHKFFGVQERPGVEIDIKRQHHILDKLDGSFISPLYLDGGIRWISKMGITDVSMQAEAFVADKLDYIQFARLILSLNCTPIFEWLSRKQRIVLDYGSEDQLVLLAIRHNVTGEYESRDALSRLSRLYGIPSVQVISPAANDTECFLANLRQQENTEGVVVTFSDGHMVKVKTDWYVQLHRAKDAISKERSLIGLILEEKLDDFLPLLPPEDRKNVDTFVCGLNADMQTFASHVVGALMHTRLHDITRKDFALSALTANPSPLRSACFALYDTPIADLRDKAFMWAKNFLLGHLGSENMLDKARTGLLHVRYTEKETA